MCALISFHFNMEELQLRHVKNPVTYHSSEEDVDMDDNRQGFCGYILITLCVIVFILTFPISAFFSFRVIKTYERGVILRLGKLTKRRKKSVVAPGVHFVLPFADKLLKIDLRTQTVNITPQDVLTSDAVTVGVDAVVFMRVTEPASALLRVENARLSSELLAVSALRTVLGSHDLSHLLNNREDLDRRLLEILDAATDRWGIKVSHWDLWKSSKVIFCLL